MRRFGRPWILAGFAALAVLGATLVYMGGRTTARDRFIDEAADVCTASKSSEVAAQNALLGPSPSRDEIVAFLDGAYIEVLRERVDRLRDLDPPDGDADEFADLLAGYSEVVDAIDAAPERFAASTADPFATIDARLDDFGLPECGSDPPAAE